MHACMCVCVHVPVCISEKRAFLLNNIHTYVRIIIAVYYNFLHFNLAVTFTADITNLSMITFKAVAQQLPVVLRQWFITLDRKAASLVEEYACVMHCSPTDIIFVNRFTKKYITPLLWRDQLATFEASPRSFDNMEVRGMLNLWSKKI